MGAKRCGCGRKYDPQHVVDGQKQNPVDRGARRSSHQTPVSCPRNLARSCLAVGVCDIKCAWPYDAMDLRTVAVEQTSALLISCSVVPHTLRRLQVRTHLIHAFSVFTSKQHSKTSITVQDCTAMYASVQDPGAPHACSNQASASQ